MRSPLPGQCHESPPLERGWRPHFASDGSSPKEESSISSGHGRNSRLINNRLRQRQKRARVTLTLMLGIGTSTRPFVSWFNSLPQEKSIYPGRPRGGLTFVPSRHLFQEVPTPPRWVEDFARAMLPLQANTLCLWVIRWRNTFVSVD